MKKINRWCLLFLGSLLVIALCGCESPLFPMADLNEDRCYVVKTKHFTAAFMRPDKAVLEKDNGRFCPAGWLLSLKNTEGEELFLQKSRIPEHYAYGCPIEFTGILQGRSGERIRIGTGIIQRPADGKGFDDLVLQRFPWICWKSMQGSECILHFFQYAESFYVFDLQIRMSSDSDEIGYCLNFYNLSDQKIQTEFYWHPFLYYQAGQSWYCLEEEKHFLKKERTYCNIIAEKALSSVSVGRCRKHLLRFFTTPPQKKTVIWKDQDIFSLEPYGTLNIASGSLKRIFWRIKVF